MGGFDSVGGGFWGWWVAGWLGCWVGGLAGSTNQPKQPAKQATERPTKQPRLLEQQTTTSDFLEASPDKYTNHLRVSRATLEFCFSYVQG